MAPATTASPCASACVVLRTSSAASWVRVSAYPAAAHCSWINRPRRRNMPRTRLLTLRVSSASIQVDAQLVAQVVQVA